MNAQGSYWRNASLKGTEISGDLVNSNFYIADLTGATFTIVDCHYLN
jgi:hypothetical protein